MDRRHFVKISAATGATATLANCGNPENQIIRFIPEEPLTPGVAVWKPGTCPLCSAACGLTVRVMEGDAEVVRDGVEGVIKKGLAKKLDGNPEHPISQGKLCVRGQAAIQVTYHPDRITQPLRRSGARGSGQFEPIEWEAAYAEVVGRLDELAAGNRTGALGFLTRPVSGGRRRIIDEFLGRFGAPPARIFEVFPEEVLREANLRSFGYRQLPTLDLGESRYVLAFGADFLGTWNSPVAQNLAYGYMRKGRPGIRGKLVHVEARMSQTGANADEWVPVGPGTEGVLALGLAHEIMASGARSAEAGGRAGAAIAGWADGLPDYTPERVAQITGVGADRVRRLAREFAGNAPAVAFVGGAPLAHTNGMFHALAVNALNALVGSVGVSGGIRFTPAPGGGFDNVQPVGRTFGEFTDQILSGADSPVEVLMVHEANPVFGSPAAWRSREAIERIPYIVAFGHFLDETSSLADIVLPDHSFLEGWTDAIAESGSEMAVATVAPPPMRPLHQTRAMPDALMEIGRGLAQPMEFPWINYQAMLGETYGALPAPEGSANTWGTIQQQGGWWAEVQAAAPQPAPVNLPAVTFAEPRFDGAPDEYPFHFLPYASQAYLDGSLAHIPWLQELPDPVTTAMWSSWVEINPRTAEAQGIAQGDLVEVVSTQGTVRAPALLMPGIAPDVIAMPVGQGHETYTRYASGRGANPIPVLSPMVEGETGAFAWAATRVRIAKVSGEADLILFAGSLLEHPEHHR